ncbi:TPA: hypothetical protein ACTGG1_003633, partial [Vibrio cholerae]|nr:hypothetical protein [Vibrio cholerae]
AFPLLDNLEGEMTIDEMANATRNIFKPDVMDKSLPELELLLKQHMARVPVEHKGGDSNNQHLYDSTYKEYIHWMDAYKHLTFLIEGRRTAKRHTFTLVVSCLALLVSGGLLLARLWGI